jgi:hypothetical protein
MPLHKQGYFLATMAIENTKKRHVLAIYIDMGDVSILHGSSPALHAHCDKPNVATLTRL